MRVPPSHPCVCRPRTHACAAFAYHHRDAEAQEEAFAESCRSTDCHMRSAGQGPNQANLTIAA
eukprot:4572327-Pleurochrysis_carterae.AAC.1